MGIFLRYMRSHAITSSSLYSIISFHFMFTHVSNLLAFKRPELLHRNFLSLLWTTVTSVLRFIHYIYRILGSEVIIQVSLHQKTLQRIGQNQHQHLIRLHIAVLYPKLFALGHRDVSICVRSQGNKIPWSSFDLPWTPWKGSLCRRTSMHPSTSCGPASWL